MKKKTNYKEKIRKHHNLGVSIIGIFGLILACVMGGIFVLNTAPTYNILLALSVMITFFIILGIGGYWAWWYINKFWIKSSGSDREGKNGK